MKLKINRRLMNIALVSLIAAAALTGFIYKTMEKAVQPEAREPVLYFKTSLEKDTFLKETDVEIRMTPKSLIPRTAVRDSQQVRDKRLLIKAEPGDMVLTGKLIERGDALVDTKQLWTIGIDVANISNFLGGNLKEGKDYVLFYRYPTGEVAVIGKGKVSSLVDSTGKLITTKGDGLVRTVNLAVDSEKIMRNIIKAKMAGSFELVDAPEGVEISPVEDIIIELAQNNMPGSQR